MLGSKEDHTVKTGFIFPLLTFLEKGDFHVSTSGKPEEGRPIKLCVCTNACGYDRQHKRGEGCLCASLIGR